MSSLHWQHCHLWCSYCFISLVRLLQPPQVVRQDGDGQHLQLYIPPLQHTYFHYSYTRQAVYFNDDMNSTYDTYIVIAIIALSAIGILWRIFRTTSKGVCDSCPEKKSCNGAASCPSCRGGCYKKQGRWSPNMGRGTMTFVGNSSHQHLQHIVFQRRTSLNHLNLQLLKLRSVHLTVLQVTSLQVQRCISQHFLLVQTQTGL